MNKMTPGRLAEIKARAKAATPGPWEHRISVGSTFYVNAPSCGVRGFCCLSGGFEREEDAEFIAHARTDIPDLIAEVERLGAENDGYKADIETGRFVRLPAAIGQIVYVPMEEGGMHAPYVKRIAFLRPDARDAVMEAVATVGVARERMTFMIAPENKGTHWFETEDAACAALGKERDDA